MAGEFVPGSGGKDCEDYPTWGQKSTRFDYIYKGQADEDNYPEEACEPWLHGNGKIDNMQVTQDLTAGGNITASEVTASGITLTSRKSFDIPHPTKNGFRLRHICLEGPEAGVYFRGRLTGKNVIELPDYWRGLIDLESVTVSLTQIGSSQDLIIEKIQAGKIYIRSGNATAIDCYYCVQAERKDGEKLIVEYEGTSFDDYPGDNSQYTCNK